MLPLLALVVLGQSTPQPFGKGVISTQNFEAQGTLTPDQRTIYFVRSNPDYSGWTIYESKFAGGQWSVPKVAPFSGTYRDTDPFGTPAGRRLYVVSDRPSPNKRHNDMELG